MRIAFYAPMKPPDHPVPSGDRQMARLLIAALEAGGHEVVLASKLRSFVSEPRPDLLRTIEVDAECEAAKLGELWTRAETRPDLWFTYHSYYKAPDFLGPRLARRFGLPYASAEASHAPKRRHGAWVAWHDAAEAAIRAGAVHFCFTPADRAGLESVVRPDALLIDLPPFINPAPFARTTTRSAKADRVELVTVAMMRPGAKSRSYSFLAEALALLPARARWRLTLVGDGPARIDILGMFGVLPPERIVWRGELDQAGIAAALGGADVFVWPGFEEAYGIGYLEAGAAGLPALAMRAGGVPSVVVDRETGILTPEGDLDEYAAALFRLIQDGGLRDGLGGAARRMVLEERSLAGAAAILADGLAGALRRAPRRSPALA